MRIIIGNDQGGYDLKEKIKDRLFLHKTKKEFKITAVYDYGCLCPDPVDYPDFAEPVARQISRGFADLGILICGSGIGMSIAANKLPGIRAAVCDNPVSARLAREHNDANILCLGARFVAPEYAQEIVKVFLTTKFSNEERHKRRIKKISQLEKSVRKKK